MLDIPFEGYHNPSGNHHHWYCKARRAYSSSSANGIGYLIVMPQAAKRD